jgi:Family of unknown function (DUF6152)
MRRYFPLILISAALAVNTAPMWGHHAFAAEFDDRKPVTLRGTVTKWEVSNPHSWIHLAVKDKNGNVAEWMIEGGSPNALFRLGFTKDALPPGTEIVVHGFQAKAGGYKAVGTDLTFADGKKLFLGGSAPGANGPGGGEASQK